MKIQAPAKLNLYLEVTGKRPNDYHELESDVVFLNLVDELEFEISENLELNSDIKDNIILKAARSLHPTKGARINLTKRIPMGGGLGGGSADAAATLFALNQLWELNLPESKLYEIALGLGADVPVCLFGHLNKTSTAHFSGIGEIVSHTQPRPDWHFLLVNPGKHLATQDVFTSFELLHQPHSGNRNDLEPAAIRIMPEIAEILQILHGAPNNIYARMTGSGSTCFAVFEKLEDAGKAAEFLPMKWWKCIVKQKLFS